MLKPIGWMTNQGGTMNPRHKPENGATILRVGHAAAWVLCLIALPALNGAAQTRPGGTRSRVALETIIRLSGEGMDEHPRITNVMEERRRQALNAERQKSIISDTNKLLRLASELNGEVAGSDAVSLTAAQLRKVAEIQKLARAVKDKTTLSTGPG